MESPTDPIAAVTHPDPYPYYAGLVARRPLHRDEGLGLWVAASAAAVTAVMTGAHGRVRPPAEPVPAAIAGSPAGEIFGSMVRFNDGARHTPMKDAITIMLDALEPSRLGALSQTNARALVDELRPQDDPARLTDFMFRLSPAVVGTLLGAPAPALADVARWTAAFVAATTPGASKEIAARGSDAAAHLLEMGTTLTKRDGLVAALARHAAPADQARVIANALGFLWQAYDATAGLVGNTLLAIARDPSLTKTGSMIRVAAEVARHDAPVQNTRRFVAEDVEIAGEQMKQGDTILVLLAAANRDPRANPNPDLFDPNRSNPKTFTFGHGAHRCPGSILATTIAAAAVESLLDAGLTLPPLARRVTYRPSANIRIPLLG